MESTTRMGALITDYVKGELHGGRTLEIDLDANMFTSGLVDSLGIMRLIAHVEKSLGLKIPPTDLIPENFLTINVMAAYLERQVKGSAG